jgi:hypothetical protein
MNKVFISLGICGLVALTGCNAGNQTADRDIYEESGNTINVNDERAELYNVKNKNEAADFGYVRHQKNPINGNTNSDYTAIDREKLADSISKLSSDLPNVHDVATLVTDEEVLIAYATDSKDRNATADQVKLTGMSVVPRYYHVYVSDNVNLIKNVESYANLSSNSRKADSLVDDLIKDMLKSPQGRKMSEVENENGVMKDEMDSKADRGNSPNASNMNNMNKMNNR